MSLVQVLRRKKYLKIERESVQSQDDTFSSTPKTTKKPASVINFVDLMTDDECSSSDSDDGDTPASEGYCFFDISILKNVIEMLVYPVCKVGTIALNEEMSSTMGFPSSFRVQC